MRKLSLLLLACLTLGIAWAERVSVNTAQQVAANVAAGLSPSNLRSSSDLKLVYAAPAKQQSGLRAAGNESDYYIFNVGTGDGFIIVAGEDRVRPVLGYSAEGEVDMEKMPENMKAWLEMYQEEISWAVSQNVATPQEVQSEWKAYLNGSQLRMGDKVSLSKPTALWDQDAPYNGMTPEMSSGEHGVTGCVATAMAIVMKYYEYPTKAIIPSNTNTITITENQAIPTSTPGKYSVKTISETPQDIFIEYDEYDWANMLLEYEPGLDDYGLQGNAVAKLMRDCGANVEMNYSITVFPEGINPQYSSGAVTAKAATALKEVFGYSQSVRYEERLNYRWEDWKRMINTEINEDRPVILNGTEPEGGGHAFICDGYTTDGTYHINWGWGGYMNGYFLLSTLDDNYDGIGYSTNQGAIIGIQVGEIQPVEDKPFIMSMEYTGESSLPINTPINVQYSIKYAGEEAKTYYVGLSIIDENNSSISAPIGTPRTYNFSASEAGSYFYFDEQEMQITISQPLTDTQRISFVYSEDGTNWKIAGVMSGVPIGLGQNGLINLEDNPNEPSVPVNITIVQNDFEDKELEVIANGSTSSYTNTGFYRFKIYGLNTDAWMCFSLEDPASWISHLRIYYSGINSVVEDAALAMIEDDKWWIPVSLSDISNNNYVRYLKVLPDKAGTIDYDIQLYGEDKKTLLAEVKGQQMKTVGAEEPEKPTVTIQMLSNPFRFRYLAVNDEYSGQRVGKTEPVQYKLTGAEGNVNVCYTLKNPEWVSATTLSCGINTYSSKEVVEFDSEGKAWIEVPAEKITDGLVTNYLSLMISEKVAENFDYSISLYNADKTVCYQTFDYTMPVINQPMILEFNPDELYGDTDEEFIFSVTAKNVDPKMANQQTSISLEIEGSVDGEVDVDLITSEGRKELNVIPYYVDANVCMTEAEIVENLAEGQVYQFALRFLDGKKPGGIIRVEEIYINGNMNAVYEGSELPIDYSPVIVVDDKISYEGSSHYGARVTVTSTGVYEINTPNASIRSLNIQPGGQIKLDTELKVGQLRISHRIPANAWTTFGVPESSQNIILGDGNSGLLERGVIASRMGYRDVNDQEWIESNEADLPPGTAILLAQNAETEQMFGFHNRLFYEEFAEPLVLPTRTGSAAPGNDDNGNYFRFVANPLWENLMINGRAYVLNEATNSFELQESPTIPPFQAYMIASEAVMNSISSLRIGDIPTSIEDLAVTGFRVWSEAGHVCFETTEAKDVAVYSMTGVQLQRCERSVGTKRVALSQGIYIVVCDGTAYKVSVK